MKRDILKGTTDWHLIPARFFKISAIMMLATMLGLFFVLMIQERNLIVKLPCAFWRSAGIAVEVLLCGELATMSAAILMPIIALAIRRRTEAAHAWRSFVRVLLFALAGHALMLIPFFPVAMVIDDAFQRCCESETRGGFW